MDEPANGPGYFYIIKTSDTPDGVYKIGKTIQTDPNKRLCRYPQYSCCMYTVHVENADLFEDIAMRKLQGVAIRRREFGLEYYEMNIVKLIDFIHGLWMKYGQFTDGKLDKNIDKFKPNGWQYFANEWLASNTDCTSAEAYDAYVNIFKTVFASNEYAEQEAFVAYFHAVR